MQSAQRLTPCLRAIPSITIRRKSPPLRHSAIILAVISAASKPETRKSLLRSQHSISLCLFLAELRSPKRGTSRLKTFDSAR